MGFCSLIISKVSRPARLRHTIQFSDVAVINKQSHYNYNEDDDYHSLSFRFYNMRKRQVIDPLLFLFFLRKEQREDGKMHHIIYELPYEINRQSGRIRNVASSRALMSLPWTVMHKIDRNSPLYGKTQQDLEDTEGEIIIILEGADELTSAGFQRRWSYLPYDILWNHKFTECVGRDEEGLLNVNVINFSDVIPDDTL